MENYKNWNIEIIKKCSWAILYNEKNEIFLMQCKYKWWEKWLVPGGEIKEWESQESALRREIKEELWIQIQNILKIGEKIKKPSNDFHQNQITFHFFDFIAKVCSTKIKPNHEITNFLWIDPQKALLELDLLDSTKNFIENYLKNKD